MDTNDAIPPTNRLLPPLVRAAACAAVLLASAPHPAAGQSVLRIDFSDDQAGPYDEAMARADFGPTVQFIKAMQDGRARIKEDAALGRRVLEVKYPKGCLGAEECAIQPMTSFPARDTAWLQYKVKFEPGFSWQRGGKLPGLCGGQCNTGCVGVSGKDGWSARMMWRGTGRLVQYMYMPGKSSDCGDDFDWNTSPVATGEWHELRNQIILNTPGAGGGTGKADGVMRSWLDGKLVLDRKNVRFRDAAAVRIDKFYFSTFHGGSSDDWRPARDSYVSFSDILVSAEDPSGFVSGVREGSGAAVQPRLRATWRNGLLALAAPGLGPVRVAVSDMRGARLATLELGDGREALHPLPTQAAILVLHWTTASAKGSLRITAL